MEARNHTLNEDVAVLADQIKKKEKEGEAKDTRMMHLDLNAQMADEAASEQDKLVATLEAKAAKLTADNIMLVKMADQSKIELENMKLNNIMVRKSMSMGRMSVI